VKEARLAESQGFDEFYVEHFQTVIGTAFLLTGSREEARDLAQETFVRAYARWAAVSQHPEPLAWLRRVVTNLALSWRRRQRVRARVVHTEQPVPPPDAPEPALMKALLWLTPSQRAVIVLRFYADLSVDQVASMPGKRPGTVRALTSQALSRLRQTLEPQGVRP
jgi:RNA polymerase sigma-70 factor (sigma-E family)